MKKKSHFFEVYITRVLKECSDTNTLSLPAKQQLNNFICIFISRLCRDISKLLQMIDRKICTTKEVCTVLGILLSGQLLKNCVLEGEKSVATFKSFTKEEDNYVAKNAKAGIIFPPNLVDKFLKKHHISSSQVNHVSIYIAAICEYIAHEILDTTVEMMNQKKRIDVYDLNLAVKKDNELSCLFTTLNVSFLVAESKSVLCKSSFERLVRKYSCNAKLTKNTLDTLRIFIEKYTIELLSYASMLATHGNRGRVLPCDIKLMYSIINKMKGCEEVVSFPERPSAPDLLSL